LFVIVRWPRFRLVFPDTLGVLSMSCCPPRSVNIRLALPPLACVFFPPNVPPGDSAFCQWHVLFSGTFAFDVLWAGPSGFDRFSPPTATPPFPEFPHCSLLELCKISKLFVFLCHFEMFFSVSLVFSLFKVAFR